MENHLKKITAVLGPTNTGKTHLAVETMLGFESGIIGFPLRLLAREIFDKCVKKIGKEKVALVTGGQNSLLHPANSLTTNSRITRSRPPHCDGFPSCWCKEGHNHCSKSRRSPRHRSGGQESQQSLRHQGASCGYPSQCL